MPQGRSSLQMRNSIYGPPLSSLSSIPDLWPSSRIIEDDELALEPDIAEDVEADPGIRLHAAEALPVGRGRGVVDVAARDGARIGADGEAEVGQGGGAGEDVAAVGLAVGGALDLLVVGGDDRVVDEEEGGACVSDGLDGGGDGFSRADGVAGGGVAPEALGVVDGDVGDGAGVFGVVDVAEVVVTGGALLEVGGEKWSVEEGFGVGEEGLLLIGGDGVDGGKAEAEEAVVAALDELRGDGLRGFDSLGGDGCAADVDGVSVDVAGGGGLVAVGDGPGLAVEELGAAAGRVDVVALLICGGQLAGEDPKVGGAGVEVEVQGLTADAHGLNILGVILGWVGDHSAVIRLGSLVGSGLDNFWDLGADFRVLADGTSHGDGTSQFPVSRALELLLHLECRLGGVVCTLLDEGMRQGRRDTRKGRSHSELLCEMHDWVG